MLKLSLIHIYPQLADTYNRRRYLTAYGKEQKTEFGTIFIDRDADGYSSASGIVSIENGIATLGDNGSVTYSFTVNAAGTYDVAVRLCYPFWDKNGIYAALDGSTKPVSYTHLTSPCAWRKCGSCRLACSWICGNATGSFWGLRSRNGN